MKVKIFYLILFILALGCDDSDKSIAENSELIQGSWVLDSHFVNGVESDNEEDISFDFYDSGRVERVDNSGLKIGTWDFQSKSRLRIEWDETNSVNYTLNNLTSNRFEYSVNLDQGTGFAQLELTYSFIKL